MVLSISIAISELLLRLTGHKPKISNEWPTVEPDPILGWKNREGVFTMPPYQIPGKPIIITQLSDGTRYSGRRPEEPKGEILILGGSFTHGYAISDNETYPWKLQALYPSYTVLNYGSPGYGTYQSLLLLERKLLRLKNPKLILYGFYWHHEIRNISTPEWLHVSLPYISMIKGGKLIRHFPNRYFELPLRESFALSEFLQIAYMKIKARNRTRIQGRFITKALLTEMNNLSRKHGAYFAVVFLTTGEYTNEEYITFLHSKDINVIDCAHKLTDNFRVPGEGHPNERLNALWSKCIKRAINNFSFIHE
jgi:hypothetical protein